MGDTQTLYLQRNKRAMYGLGWLVLVGMVGESTLSLVSYPIHWLSSVITLLVISFTGPLIWLLVYAIVAMFLVWITLIVLELVCKALLALLSHTEAKQQQPIVQYIERPHRCGFAYKYQQSSELESPEGNVLESRREDARASGVTLALSDAERDRYGHSVAVLKRHVTHLIHIVYGQNDEKIGLVNSTVRDYGITTVTGVEWDELTLPQLTFLRSFTSIYKYTQREAFNRWIQSKGDDTRTGAVSIGDNRSDKMGSDLLLESQNYNRKPSTIEFIDERLYSSGHRVVTRARRSQKMV